MPFLVPIIAGALSLGGFITVETAFIIADGIVAAGMMIGLNAVKGLLSPKPAAAGVGTTNLQNRGAEITGTNATKARDLIYGNVGRVPGTVVFRDFSAVNGFNQGRVHLIIALAGHQVASISDPYLQNYTESAPLDSTTGDCNSGKFAGKLHCEKFLGTPTQTACATLVAAASSLVKFPNGWTTNHRLQGVAYVYVTMDWDENVFNQGFPDLRFDIVGKNDLYDPRTGTTSWSNNPIICLRDYFTWAMGIGCYASEVNDTIISAEANVCDEDVALAAGGTEKRFASNGRVDLSQTPADIVTALLSSCAGTPAYLSGQWAFYAAHWRGAVGSITDDDLASGITVNARQASSDLYNAVAGMFVSADNNWQTADFPMYYHSVDRGYATDDYLAEDGGQSTDRRIKQIQLAFTTSPSMAQRLAKIDLESFRRQKTVTLKTKIKKFAHQPPDVLTFSHPRYGASFIGKTFVVNAASLTMEQPQDPAGLNGGQGSQQQTPALLMNFTLRETDANVYAWSTAEELAYIAPSGSPSGSAPPAPLIAQQLISIPTGLQFAFNFITYAVVQGYWVYRSASSDPATAARYRFVPQSTTAGTYTFQDTVGAGVTWYYWITAINTYGESAKEATFAGATSGLSGTDVMTVYRPSTSSGTYSSQSAAYDNNLNVSSNAFVASSASKQSVWNGFGAITGTVVSVTLRVVHGALFGGIGTQVQTATIEVSINGGSSWTTLDTLLASLSSDYDPTTVSMTLSTSQDMTQVQVRATTTTGASTNATHNVYEIWAEVVTS